MTDNLKDHFSVFVAEDEQPARDYLLELLFKRMELKVEGWAKDGEDALQKLSRESYDLLFLDINLPVISGVELLEKLKNPPYIIFTTAYADHALKAFDLGAVDYLLKPFSEDRFNTAVDKAVNILKNSTIAKSPYRLGFTFMESDEYYILPYNEIIYFTSVGRNTDIHTEGRIYNTRLTLKEVSRKISSDIFVRIHRQCIVNMTYVAHIQYFVGGQYMAFLKDKPKNKLIIGRTYASDVLTKMRL